MSVAVLERRMSTDALVASTKHETDNELERLTGVRERRVVAGVDLERDVLGRMGFKPIVRGEPMLMDARIFQPGIMGLKDDLFSVPIVDRSRDVIGVVTVS